MKLRQFVSGSSPLRQRCNSIPSIDLHTGSSLRQKRNINNPRSYLHVVKGKTL